MFSLPVTSAVEALAFSTSSPALQAAYLEYIRAVAAWHIAQAAKA